MPYQNEVLPIDIAGRFQQGRVDALNRQGLQQRNALGQLQVQQAQGLNALAQNPTATPEQYIRAGDIAGGTALAGIQQQQETDKQQSLARVGGIAKQALSIADPGQRKGFLQQALTAYGKDFQALGSDMSQVPQMLALPDDQLAQHLQQVAQFAAPPTPIKLGANESLVAPNAQGTAVNTLYQAPESPTNVETARHNKAMEGLMGQRNAAASGVGNMLTPEGQDLAAQEYLNTGRLPPGLGKASAGINAKIVSRAAEMAAANGNDAQAAALNRAAFKSAQSGLTALTKQRTLVGAFERTALKNLEIALDESNKVDRTGVPAVNRWLLAGKKSLTGDVEVGRFNAALTSALNEYAKVLSGATGAAGISDAARREAHDLLNTANTPEQVIGIVDIMKREMANREAGFAEQEAQLKETMGGRPNVGVAPASAGAPAAPGAPMSPQAVPTATGPNGQKLYLRNGQWSPQ